MRPTLFSNKSGNYTNLSIKKLTYRKLGGKSILILIFSFVVVKLTVARPSHANYNPSNLAEAIPLLLWMEGEGLIKFQVFKKVHGLEIKAGNNLPF